MPDVASAKSTLQCHLIPCLNCEMKKTITPAQFADSFQLLVQEADREPVLIDVGVDDPLVLITLQEYHRLLDLDRRVYATHDLPEDLVQAILDAKPSVESARFNDEWDKRDR